MALIAYDSKGVGCDYSSTHKIMWLFIYNWWINDYIPYKIIDVIIYTCPNLNWIISFVTGTPGEITSTIAYRKGMHIPTNYAYDWRYVLLWFINFQNYPCRPDLYLGNTAITWHPIPTGVTKASLPGPWITKSNSMPVFKGFLTWLLIGWRCAASQTDARFINSC